MCLRSSIGIHILTAWDEGEELSEQGFDNFKGKMVEL